MIARILDITAAEYHADPCEVPSLSCSIAKIIAAQSPQHAYAKHPRLGGVPFKPTETQERGTLVHRLLLGKGSEIAVCDFDSWRTDKAKAAKKEAIAAHRLPVLAEDYVELVATSNRIADNFAEQGIVLNGDSEVVIEWDERLFLSDLTVRCRAMLDHLFIDRGVIYDVKTIASAHPDKVARAIDDYGYDIQHAGYTAALRALRPELAGREDFVLLFCETEEPYAVNPVRLDGQFRALGERRWSRAARTWHQCMKTGVWPGYGNGIASVEPTPWMLAKESA